jgi:hypothetical protein
MIFESPPNKTMPISDGQQLDAANQIRHKGGTVILKPLAMRIPNSHGIYSLSQLSPQRVVSEDEFLLRYADHARRVRVCLDEIPSSTTIFERSQLITVYGFGLDCWYIVAAHNETDDSCLED